MAKSKTQSGKIPANVGFSMSPQGNSNKQQLRAQMLARKIAVAPVKIVDGYIVPLES